MSFFHTFYRSVTSIDSYKLFLLTPLKSSIFYAIRWYLLFFIVGTTVACIYVVPEAQRRVQSLPEEFSLTYAQEKLSTTPNMLPFTYELTSAEMTLTATASAITITQQDGPTTVAQYTELFPQNITEFTVTKPMIQQEIIPTTIVCVVAFALGLLPFLLIGRVIWLLAYSALIYTLLHFLGKHLPYMSLVHLGIYAVVVAEVVHLLSLAIYKTPAVPLFDLTFFLVMILVLRSLKRENE